MTPTNSPTEAPITSLEEEDSDATPIIVEVLPNPTNSIEEYIEIYNPHSVGIDLETYKICIQNGSKNEPTCNRLMDFTLEPGAFFMLCRDPDYIAESRTCHQQESFNIRNGRKQFITLQRITDNSQQGTVDEFVSVDEVAVPISRKHETEAYVRKNGQMDRYCSTDCWTWMQPSTASIDIANVEIAEADLSMPIDIQTYPPTDE